MFTAQSIRCDCGREVFEHELFIGPAGEIECNECHQRVRPLSFLTTDILNDFKLKWELERINQHPDYLVINGKRHYIL